MENKHMSHMFEATWSKKQDSYHFEYKKSFENFCADKINLTFHDFPNFYPTNGSSEAIREEICYLASQGKTIMVFEGEYEGYEMIAKAMSMETIKINRENWLAKMNVVLKEKKVENLVFFLSEPSSIDGKKFDDFENFMSFLEKNHVACCLDIAYLGLVNKYDYSINYSNIQTVFFSLSKIFGVYYHRIGGCYRKEPNPLLYGNMWFKNLYSMNYGQQLLESMNDHRGFILYLKDLQNESINYINQKIEQDYGLNNLIEKTEIPLLGLIHKQRLHDMIQCYEKNQTQWLKLKALENELFEKYDRDSKLPFFRVCLSPVFERFMKERI